VAALRSALATAAAPVIEAAGVEDVPARLEEAAARLPPDTLFIAYQTVVRDYVPEAARARYTDGMRAWVAGTAGARRALLELEPFPGAWTEATPMAITALIRGAAADASVESLVLARCGYHPQELAVDDAAASAFARAAR
jgi:hypothetical protein